MSTRAAALLAALLLCLCLGLVAGCGGDDDGGSTTTVTTATGEDEGGGEPIPDGSGFNAQAVYERAAPGVVTVVSVFDGGGGNLEDELAPEGGALPPGDSPQAGQGSGFVISDDGEIVTNAHVVTDGQTGGGPINQASEVFVQFPDRNSVEAEVIGFDPFADVALIKVDPEGLDLKPVELANIEDVEVGEQVAAIGSPFGERQSLSIGFVSALDRSIPSLTSFQIDGAIQTDASINPGNSGGPLLDSQARVIGINQQIDTTSGGNQGVGFAVPIDLAERSIEQLREDGEVEYAYIGVGTKPLFPQLAEELEVDADAGAIVEDVTDGSPADEAGLQAGDREIDFQAIPYNVGGDIIVSVDGEEIVTETDLPRIVSRLEPGQEVTVGVIRDGEEEELDITLGTRPTRVPQAG
ncbi:MAG: trypsin-like peptidase domain-containing protein [Actinomycetota bacterium]|nr:trypsin-like peptidase domain-containing protein [Actinomycetota bacterium]